MAHSIRDLISKVPAVTTGNRYKVEIFLPRAMTAWNASIDQIQFYCKECSLPGMTLTQLESRVYGQKRMLGSFLEAGSVSTSFLFDYKGLNVKLFNAWINYIQKPESKRLEYYENYIGRVRITLLNGFNKTIYVCNLEEAYPVKVNEVALGYTQTEILPLDIDWSYRSLSTTSDSDESSIVESAIKQGTSSVGDLVDSPLGEVENAVTGVLQTIGRIEEAADRIRTAGRGLSILF